MMLTSQRCRQRRLLPYIEIIISYFNMIVKDFTAVLHGNSIYFLVIAIVGGEGLSEQKLNPLSRVPRQLSRRASL